MQVLMFLRSFPGRLLRIALGVAMLAAGVGTDSMTCLFLTSLGLVPLVGGVANICVLDDLAGAIASMVHRTGTARHRS